MPASLQQWMALLQFKVARKEMTKGAACCHRSEPPGNRPAVPTEERRRFLPTANHRAH